MERISLEEAQARLLAGCGPVAECETAPLSQLPGRVLCADLTAQCDVPPFDRSPLDGYALRSADLAGAGPDSPAVLTVAGKVFAGGWWGGTVGPGQAVRIMTGAPIPAGADCVVRQEDTDGGEDAVRVFTMLARHRNFCFRGEDMRAGSPLLAAGTRLDWTHIAALAGQGISSAKVFRRPRAAVLSTGDELTAQGLPLAPGKIYDSNGPMLCARLAALHAEPVMCPLGTDDPAALAAHIRERLQDCDLVVTSGGVSVGEKDCMVRAAELLGAQLLFHGVGIKPGGPVMGMLVEGRPVIALSGNPFAAAACFEVLARPVVERLSGRGDGFPKRRSAILRGSVQKSSPIRRLMRARLEGEEVHLAAEGHTSGMVLGLAGCNCLIDVPSGVCPGENARVDVFVL